MPSSEDVVREGATDLERRWRKSLSILPKMFAKAGGSMWGLWGEQVAPGTLEMVLFGPPNSWRKYVTTEERDVLFAVKSMAAFQPYGGLPYGEFPSEEALRRSLKQLAKLADKVVLPALMRDYIAVSKQRAFAIQTLCEEEYGSCTRQEGELMFQADFERLAEKRALGVDADLYPLYRRFVRWLQD